VRIPDARLPTRRAGRRGGLTAFSSLQERRFRAWFLTQVLSASGTMTQSVAASWLVFQMTGRAVDLGYLAAVTIAPTLLLGAWAGSLADRLDRRRLLLATQSAFLVLGLVLAALTLSGHASLPAILAVSALTGTVMAVDNPARQVYVLDLVGRQRLASAVSLYEVVLNASRVIGPAAGGALLALSGPAACFLLNAATYLPPIAVLIALRVGSAPHREQGRGTSVRAGISAAWSDPVIRASLLLAALSGTLFNFTVVFPVLAQESFHLGASGYGLLVASFGVGAVPGALLAASRPTSGRLVRRLALAAGSAAALTAVAPDAEMAYLGMALVGLSSIWFVAAANTLVQLQAPPALRGRVMGVWTMALPGMGPLTGMTVAVLMDATSPRWGYAAMGLAMVLGATATRGWLGGIRRAPALDPV
jgi:MFS family permease